MPSTRERPLRRRRLLAGLATALTGGLAGCGGRLPGTGPTKLDAEATVDRNDDPQVRWRYPPREGDADGIGTAAVALDRIVRRERTSPAVALTLSSTVGGIAASEPYRGYRLDWFRVRIWPPTGYDGRLNHEVRVAPPGQWDGFTARYEIRGEVRHTIVELRDVDSQGTIQIPAVFDPGGADLPDRLHCSVTVQASRSGPVGRTVRVTGRETLPIASA
jgi:hypothetical protein